MENDKKTEQNNSTNQPHPKPSDDVQLDIETVTPETEKDAGKESEEPKNNENKAKPESDKEDSSGTDKADDIETVAP